MIHTHLFKLWALPFLSASVFAVGALAVPTPYPDLPVADGMGTSLGLAAAADPPARGPESSAPRRAGRTSPAALQGAGRPARPAAEPKRRGRRLVSVYERLREQQRPR